jgi:response regulator RpfG family c-di-GMP phosphodiesterase
MILHQHERWGGQDYPASSKNVKIHLAYVIAVASYFDAMATNFPYCRALSALQVGKMAGGLSFCRGVILDIA